MTLTPRPHKAQSQAMSALAAVQERTPGLEVAAESGIPPSARGHGRCSRGGRSGSLAVAAHAHVRRTPCKRPWTRRWAGGDGACHQPGVVSPVCGVLAPLADEGCRRGLDRTRNGVDARATRTIGTTDPGAQVTSVAFATGGSAGASRLDGRGRGCDHRFAERGWRTGHEAERSLTDDQTVLAWEGGVGPSGGVETPQRLHKAFADWTLAEVLCRAGRGAPLPRTTRRESQLTVCRSDQF